MFGNEADLLRKMRIADSVKAELVLQVGAVFQAMAAPRTTLIQEALAAVIVTAYVLARRLGLDLNSLDQSVAEKLQADIRREPEWEKWYGDCTAVQRHVQQKR